MRRRRKTRRSTARLKVNGVVPAGVPRCCTCGKPLLRLPASRGSRVYQCADCFYPGTGRSPAHSEPIASERARWLAEHTSDLSG